MHVRICALLRAVALTAIVAAGAITTDYADAATGPLRIAFTGSASNTSDVCTINPDGTNKVCVSSGYRPSVTSANELFFVDNHDNSPSETRAIYRANADGSNVQLVRWNALEAGPESVDASADGTTLVYDRWVGNGPFSDRQIFAANGDGSGERKLTDFIAASVDGPRRPSLSPDGTQIVFFDCINGPIVEYGNICTLPIAGGTPKVIATRGEDPRWSESGRIAYTDLDTQHIVLIDGDGGNKVDTGIVGSQPALSPDGLQVAFMRQDQFGGSNVWVANVDGSNQRDLGFGHNPDWYPGVTPAASEAPSVSVTSPLGGEIVGGQPVTFTWAASEDTAFVSLALESYEPTLLHGDPNETINPDDISFGFTIANLDGAARSFTWTPPENMQDTVRYVRVAVTDAEGQVAIATTSNYVRTRPSANQPPSVRLGYPSDPGTRWYGGDTCWTSSQIIDSHGIGKVEFWLSTDDGATYPTLLGSGFDTTSISCVVPNTATDKARVKLIASDTLGNTASDVSDYPFTIIGKSLGASTLTLNPISVVGGGTSLATVTLTGAAPAGGATVTLSSSKTLVATVPASVTVPAGSTSATFTVSTKAVSTSTNVGIYGTHGLATAVGSLTVTPSSSTSPPPPPPPSTGSVSITRAEYDRAKRSLRVEALSSSSSATLKVHVASTGALIGTLNNLGGGKYGRTFSWPTNPTRITVKSSTGASASAYVRVR